MNSPKENKEKHCSIKSDSYQCHTVLVNLEDEELREDCSTKSNNNVLPIVMNDLEWYQASVLVAKLQFGLAVLGIPSTFHSLGIIPGTLILIIFTLITTFSGFLVTEIRQIHPHIHNVQDVGKLCFGNWGARLIGLIYFLFAVLVVSAGLLTSSIALNALTGHAICTMIFIALTALISSLIGSPLRNLHKVSWLGWIGMTCILTSVWILVVALAIRGHPYYEQESKNKLFLPVERPLWGKGNFSQCMVSINLQIVAVMGNVSFYSVSAEMRKPEEFSKAVVFGQAFNLINYLIIGLVVSFIAGQYITSPALGSAGPIMEKICFGIALPGLLVSIILWTNVAAKYAYHRMAHCSIRVRDASNLGQWCFWLLSYGGSMILAFIFAGSIPIFDELMGLTGATAGPLFVLILTGLTQIYILRYRSKKEIFVNRKQLIKSYVLYGISIGLIVLGVFLSVAGIYGSIQSIHDAYKSNKINSPFSCVDNALLYTPVTHSSS